MDITETLKYIHSVDWKGSRPGLARITELMHALGDPQDNLKFIHVAGTNGKGSFCAMTERVLTAQGYKTGLFTSPYVAVFNERMQIGGINIPDDELCDVTERVKACADKMIDLPTEFELITAIGLCWFADKKCDYVVLECGMGGRLDSTNVVKNTVLSVITGVALDHTRILGKTIFAIAGEKSGIIKPGVPVLFGGNSQEALAVIKAAAEQNGSELFITDRGSVSAEDCTVYGSAVTYKGAKHDVSLAGAYQPYNAANVIEAVSILNKYGVKVSKEALDKGLSTTHWPARFELIQNDPIVVYDGGHNPEGAQAVVDSVKLCLGGRCILISGVMADKAHHEVAMTLADVAVRAYTVTPDNPRALDAEDWADDFIIYGVTGIPCASMEEAIAKAKNYAVQNSLPIVATGSLYMYEGFRKAIVST